MIVGPPLLSLRTAFLAPFFDAGIFEHADVHVTAAVGRTVPEVDDATLLAVALAVRATRLGHVCVVLDDIPTSLVIDEGNEDRESTVSLGELPWPDDAEWAGALRMSPAVAAGSAAPGEPIRPLVFDGGRVYLERYWRHEQMVGTDLLERAASDPVGEDVRSVPAALLDQLFGSVPEGSPDLQRVAAEAALTRRLVVIAGGPGTGKTRTVARLLAAAHRMAIDAARPLEVALAAPTGKAAQRMTDAVRNEITSAGLPASLAEPLLATEASTIHRLLGPTGGLEFRHHRDDPLAADIVVIDEASMVSLPLMARLLDAVRPDARLVLVGDPYQLTSIEAGAVLGDVVGPAAVAGWGGSLLLGPLSGGVVVLERVHRFGADSAIAALADAVRSGDADGALAILRAGAGDVTWVHPDDPTARGAVDQLVVENALDVVGAARAGDRLAGLAAVGDTKVLAATRRGPLGTYEWRERIERLIAQRDARVPVGRRWYIGRPVIVTENDYSNALFNGDTGLVVATDDGSAVVFPRGDATRDLQPSQLAQVETWWSMTIHKSQGSEFRHVVVSLPKAGSPILTRELLYTGITRAREQLTIVADEAAVRAAVERTVARASGLQARLWP
ncbi:MAG: exodeoxyribonuclease V subunit alpha [Acidimicrobiia bacterium]